MPTTARPDFRHIPLAAACGAALPLPEGDFWVFGYGSLMWRPGFAAVRSEPARLFGYHRRLCLWSIHYRGTYARPGLVLGLDRGGSCGGMAFLVARKNAARVAEYLRRRELMHDAYRPVVKRVHLRGGGVVSALAFVSRPEHPQFAPRLGVSAMVEVIGSAAGKRGRNCDYVFSTVRELEALSIAHSQLLAVAAGLRAGGK